MAELAVEPAFPDPLDAPDFAEGDAPRVDTPIPAEGRARRGRRRGRGDRARAEQKPAAQLDSAAVEPALSDEPEQGRVEPVAGARLDTDRPPRRRRGRRRSGGAARDVARDVNGPRDIGETASEPHHVAFPEAEEESIAVARAAAPLDRDPAPAKEGTDAERARKRHRRGRRGGRGRERADAPAKPARRESPASPVEVETIPFEDDELPNLDGALELPELPAEAELVKPPAAIATPARGPRPRRRGGRRGERTGREARDPREARPGRGPRETRETRETREPRKVRVARDDFDDVEPDSSRDEPPLRAAPRRKNVILVNAADREEVRVAVVEDGQISDFQMNVKRHKSLVNDIYRGRVVNLEPAIGAAFVDFGQGRNGFLHTSDVLSVYGDDDWSLSKLLTVKVDPEEWDSESSQPDVGREIEDHGGAARGASSDGEPHEDVEPQEPHDDDASDEMAEVFADDSGDELATEPAPRDGGATLDRELESDDEPDTEAASAPPRGRGGRSARPDATLPPPVRGDRAAGRQVRGARNTREARDTRERNNGGRLRARPRLPITDLLEKGQVVVVQITKDAIGDKGPTLTTYISIPGRHLVLMPSMARTGVSRKIEDEKERRRLKRILQSLDNMPPGMGVIVRTAGVGCTREDLQRDLDYLLALWADFEKKLELGRGPAPLYQESDVAIRTVRDLFSNATEAVIVDDKEVYDRVREFTTRLMPAGDVERIKLHEGPKPLFHTYNIEQDFERIFSRRIDLPAGGSIVFDQTEALVAIDVNSGKTRSSGFEFEEIALKTNLEAAPEIARQIRLRDLGGIIVCDFIDMTRAGNRRAVERAFRTALALDRARSKVGRISQFGLLELTRQRLGPGLSKMLFHNCPRCRGSGRLRTVESRSGAILRRLGAALSQKGFAKIEVRAAPDVVEYLQRLCAAELAELERSSEREITLLPVGDQMEDSVLRYLRPDGREVRPGGRRKR